MAVGSELQIITPIEDFWEIAKRDEFFFWHFISGVHEDKNPTSIQPIFGETNQDFNYLIQYQKMFNIKIYESYTKDSYDFLINLGYTTKHLLARDNMWLSEFLGFKKGLLIDATHLYGKCYCPSGVLEVIRNTDPKTFESVLGIEKENLK